MAWHEDADRAVLAAEALGEEFLALELAATVTYYRLTEIRRRLPPEHFAEQVHLAAIALSTVAPIYMVTSAGAGLFVLSSKEIDELLFHPLKTGERPPLDGLRVRKADMQKGIEALKLAKNAFGIKR
jgi:hypothetical protein